MAKQTKPITIITTIQPPDGRGKRKLTVAAAPEGEMPVTLTGLFADWHALEAEVYVAVSTRKSQVVKVAAAKKSRAGKRKDEDEPEEKPDQLVQPEETTETAAGAPEPAAEPRPEPDPLGFPDEPLADAPAAEDEEQLPLIEGDTHG